MEEAEFLADDWTSDGEGGGKRSRGDVAGSRSAADDPFVRADDSESDSDPSRTEARSRARAARRFGAGRARDSDAEDEAAAPQQIIFCSRTHSQLTQVVGELNRTRFGGAEGTVSAVAVAGRRQLCVNPAALAVGTTAARLNERCLELGKQKGGGKRAKKSADDARAKKTDDDGSASRGGCPFLRRRRGAVEDLAEAALAMPMDIEDLAAAGVRHRACPYYAARRALPRADLVFAPYASVLQKETRESLGIRLEGAVVVFDEAHNLVEAVHGAHGATLTGRQIAAVRAMLSAYLDRFRSRLAPGNLRHLRTLVALAAAFERALSDDGAASAARREGAGSIPATFGEIRTLNDFLFACGADNVNVFALTRYLRESKVAHKIAGYGEHVAAAAAARRAAGEPEPADAEVDRWNWEADGGENAADADATTVVARAATEEDASKQQPRVGSVHAMAAFIASLAAADADGRVLIERPGPGESSESGGDGGRLKYVLLDSAARFRQVVDEARAVVLVGGTLAPIPELARQLFPNARPRNDEVDEKVTAKTTNVARDDPSNASHASRDASRDASSRSTPRAARTLTSLSCGHVVPRESLLPIAVSAGPTGRSFDFSFASRGAPEMMDELGRLVANACAVVPGGAVVFFPSFKYADDVYARWVKTGVLHQIAKSKTVFREPRTAAKVEKALRDFAAAIASAAGRGANVAAKPGVRTGAVMLCVCGGKLSEGINFKDELGRLVVMVGLPFANPEEPELKARMTHLDASERANRDGDVAGSIQGGKTRGRAYYEALCMRAVNQSVGRAIRHVGDYAAIVFADARYAPAGSRTGEPRGIATQLPGWIGERLVVPAGYGQVQGALARFFAQRREGGEGGNA